MTVNEKYQSWLNCPAMNKELLDDLKQMDDYAVNDSFYRELSFGTGGLRGILGAGTNRMNLFTVHQATSGLGNFLLQKFTNPSCAISFDSRIHSRDFAELSAAVLSSMGIRVFLYPDLAPTPMLSFAVRYLKASAGIMITASHNPAEFNGYKVYGADGCQITLEAAEQIQSFIKQEPILRDTLPSFEEQFANGIISFISDKTVESYYRMIMGLRVHPTDQPLHLVYSPLNGAGNIPVREILRRLGNVTVDLVHEQELPDGHFPTCPYPNPEIRAAMQLAIDRTIETGADLCFATDPDSDRMGAGVRVGNEVILINGNDMGVLMIDYLCRYLDFSGLSIPPVAVKTIVSSEMFTAVCNKYHVEVRNVLTGFKFIGEQIGLLEKAGQLDRYIFGFEESYGYLSGTEVRDKDAVNAALLLVEMAANLKAEGLTLLDRLDQLRQEFGFYGSRLLTFQYQGEDGALRMKGIMSALRSPLSSFQEDSFRKAIRTDYLYDDTGLPQSDVLVFSLPNEEKVVVRPSGTEPKLKAYLFSKGESPQSTETSLDRLESIVRVLCG